MSSNPSLLDEQAPPLPAPKLGPIHVPKSSEVLASQLRVHILDGTIGDGAALPAERDLVIQTGLSRGSVREALRILHTEGLITTRPGRLGGAAPRRRCPGTVYRPVRPGPRNFADVAAAGS